MLSTDTAAIMEGDGALSVARDATDAQQLSIQGKEHLWVLPASTNWYCSKVRFWANGVHSSNCN
jgi:hypothetical protein